MKKHQAMKSGEVLCDRYRLNGEIGKGGMGTVWAAYDLKAHREVALKMILPQAKVQEQELRLRLLREARAIKKVEHRNIVKIYAVGKTSQGEPFLVLEYLRGQTLADKLKESFRLEPYLAAWIIADVASGLAVAHAAQVIHRDLKPANIFLRDAPDVPKYMFVPTILDFGVCKDLDGIDDFSTLTVTGVVPGSLAYMSPQQLETGEKLDFRTDIWSLGIVLYELLTGERPFLGSPIDLYNQILAEPVSPPSTKVRGVPPELDAVVARCTAKSANGRYKNADELARVLYAIAGKREMKRSVTPTVFEAPIVNPNAPRYTPPVVTVVEQVDSDLAVTVLRPQRKIDVPRQSDARAQRSVHGTEIMPLSQTIASPAPKWEEIVDALKTRRQSSINCEEEAHRAGARGETEMLDLTVEPITSNPSLTTSAISAVSQPGCRATTPSTPPSPSRRTRPFSHEVLLGSAIGVFVLAVGLMMWFVVNGDKPYASGPGELVSPSAAPTNNGSTLSPQEPPQMIDSSLPVAQPPPAHDAPAPTTASSTRIAPRATSAPTATAPAHSLLPTSIIGGWPRPPKTMQKCTGIGVFKRCK